MKRTVAGFSMGLCLLFVAGCDDDGGGDKRVDGGGNATAAPLPPGGLRKFVRQRASA